MHPAGTEALSLTYVLDVSFRGPKSSCPRRQIKAPRRARLPGGGGKLAKLTLDDVARHSRYRIGIVAMPAR